jgi:ribosome-associated protein YbcJ (S4-like RNA binding protein)
MCHPAHPLPARRRGPAALRWLAWALWGCCFFAGLTPGLAQDPVAKEYQIKAAYLYNFAKFVEWPAPAFTNNESPLVIGVFGPNPFGDELIAIAKDHKINGRSIVIKHVATLAEARGVHLMFFGDTEDGHIAGTLAALKENGVLTVGESEKFIASGGMISFVLEENRVRFEINAAAAERQGMKISAQLLKLAKTVRNEPRQLPP